MTARDDLEAAIDAYTTAITPPPAPVPVPEPVKNRWRVTESDAVDADVKKYQTAKGVTADGLIGNVTWGKMRADLGLVPIPAPTPAPVPAPAPAGTQPPITRSGTKLYRGIAQWKFVGVNMDAWYGCHGGGEVPTDAQLGAYFAQLNPHSLTRIWPYSRDTAMTDRIVAAAKAAGQYLLVTLWDSNPDQCGTKPIDLGNPKNNLTEVAPFIRRYAGEPAVAVWELTNELSGTDSIGWFGTVAAGIKALDAGTLVTTGSMPSYAFGGRSGYEAAHASPAIDLLSVHEYDTDGFGPSHWGLDAAISAQKLGKPWFVGEDGLCCGGGDSGNRTTNAANLTKELNAYVALPDCAGVLYWRGSTGSEGGRSDTLDCRNPADPMWSVLRSIRHPYQGT